MLSYSPNLGRKYRKKPKPSKKYAHPEAVPFRVTLWLVPSVLADIKRMALVGLPVTARRKPRTGVVVSELVCYALEQIYEDLK